MFGSAESKALRNDVRTLTAANTILRRENEALRRDLELAKLRSENALLRGQNGNGLTLRVSTKGAVSVYGVQKFPVTLYRGQWERVLGAAEEIRAFIAKNASALSDLKKGNHAP